MTVTSVLLQQQQVLPGCTAACVSEAPGCSSNWFIWSFNDACRPQQDGRHILRQQQVQLGRPFIRELVFYCCRVFFFVFITPISDAACVA